MKKQKAVWTEYDFHSSLWTQIYFRLSLWLDYRRSFKSSLRSFLKQRLVIEPSCHLPPLQIRLRGRCVAGRRKGGKSKREQEGEGTPPRSSRVRSSRASRAFPVSPLQTPATQGRWKSTRKTRAEKTGCSQANEILMNLRPDCQSHNGYQSHSWPTLLVLYLGYVWCRNMGRCRKKSWRSDFWRQAIIRRISPQTWSHCAI